MGTRKGKIWDIISALIFLLGALLYGAGCVRFRPFWMAGGGVLVLSGVVLALCKLRCPFCHRFLGFLSAGNMSFCHWCGARLEENSRDI